MIRSKLGLETQVNGVIEVKNIIKVIKRILKKRVIIKRMHLMIVILLYMFVKVVLLVLCFSI